jgi:FKBP-type peptidyl-prolyl cis-trans isomerase FklB
MATNNESDSEKNNDASVPSEAEQEGLSAEQAGEHTYSEAEAWKKSKNTLLMLLGLIAIGVAGYTFVNNSNSEEQSARSYRFLSASTDSEGAEERFLSFAEDYDDTLGGVARYRAAVIQYKDKRYGDSAKNFEQAARELASDPLAGRALLGQAVSLIKDEAMKGGEGKAILETLASGSAYLPTDRQEARFLLALQSLAENDMDAVNAHKEQLATDINASYFLSRLEDLIKTNNFLAVAKSLPDINLAKGQAFLEKNGKRKGVITLESGLQYEVLTKGSGISPKSEDKVEVHYHGTLIDGEVFDSSIDRGEPTSFQVDGVIKGWTEALQLMKQGAKWKLFIPADIAYGETGSNSIGPNETLIFEVELIGITPKVIPEPPLDLNLTDANSSSAEAPLIIPEVDANASVPVVEENATVPADGNGSE